MGLLSKLFGRAKPEIERIPPACFEPFENNTRKILSAFTPELPSLYASTYGNRKGIVAALIALNQPKWQGLVMRLNERPKSLYLTPETLTHGKVNAENIGDKLSDPCWVYTAPVVAGRKMTVGVFVLELNALVESFASINVPLMFATEIRNRGQEKAKIAGHFPVVVLAKSDLDVYDLPLPGGSHKDSGV